METKNKKVIIIVVLIIAINIPYKTLEPYKDNEIYTVSEPYTTTETYSEKEPYEAIENVDMPYQETVQTQWNVVWYPITGAGQWGSSVGSQTFPSTFNYNWGEGSVYSIYYDYIGFIATATINVPNSRPVYFKIGSDDGSKLYVDSHVIIDLWNDHPYTITDKTIELTTGKHTLELRYYEGISYASVSFETDKDILTWQEQKTRTEQQKVVKYRDVSKDRIVTRYRDIQKSREVIKFKEVKLSLIQRILSG